MFENGAIESMKTLKLALGRVAYYFRYHKLILVLFLLGMVACVLAFAFFYGTTALQKWKQQTRYFPVNTMFSCFPLKI